VTVETVNDDTPIPLKTRMIMLGMSCLVTLGCAEGLVRFADGGAMPMIHLFESTSAGSVRLVPGRTRGPSPSLSLVFELSTPRHRPLRQDDGWRSETLR
jgi:hypothetical protein